MQRQQGQGGNGGMQPTGKFIEAAALLSHIKMLESRLPEDENQFGHPQPPQLHMCRIPDPDRVGGDLGVVAMMAVTKRCISAQLLRESVTFTAVGAPVEVLVMSGVDRINCASLVALEHPELTAADTLIVADRDSGKSADSQPVLSLMSGGIVPVAPSPRVAVVVGTSDSRVITIEFSVKPVSMQLVRRNFFAGEQVRSYYEPLPWDTLTEAQQKRRRLPLSKQLSRVSIDSDKTDGAREPRGIVPFVVTDGVKTIEQYSIVRNEKSVTYVWISFGDGTAVRVHHAALFASVVQKHAESQPNKKSLEEVLGDQVIRWQAKLPPLEDTRVTLFPIPKYHPSPLAPIPSWKIPELEDKEDDPAGGNGKHEDRQEFFEAILYCTGAMADSFPTLTFYTSENQFGGRIQGDPEVETQDRDAGALKGIIGGLLGIFSGGGNSPPEEESGVTPELARDMSKEDVEVWDPAVPLPSINFEPLSLFAGCEIHDPPRQITFCTIDPEGDLAAFADTLGRVSLVDLASKQIIRMWKGFRDTSCSWIQVPQENRQKPWQKNKVLYLVIHSRQRKVVEVWRTRHGPKVKSMQVGREAQLINCKASSPIGLVATCYLAHSNVPFSSMNKVERIIIKEEEVVGQVNVARNRQLKRLDASQLSQDAVMRLNHLQQLLGETNVECQSIDVFKALSNIKSIEDLATALDLIASSSTLEGKMGVEGSTFQKLAVSQCKTKLDEAISDAGEEALSNPHVQMLAFKIAYYTQLATAYDILHRYETGDDEGDVGVVIVTPSTWSIEAAGWTSVYEKITKTSVDDDSPLTPIEPMRFQVFASACVPPKKWMEAKFDNDNGGYTVYLSDSSKTRKDVLTRVFKPLLGDIFSFKVVNQIFESLGIKDDYEYLLKCFGEWFTSLPVKAVTKKAIFAEDSPTNRWLQDIVGKQLEENPESQQPPMESLYEFCRSSEELVRAFWLAALCRESASLAATEIEEKTYGKISSEKSVSRWDQLLRKIRVCLLVSLRLNGVKLGACPISVKAVEKGDNFSIFEWVVKDELTMSHNNDEIVSLENACRISSHIFDPSTPAGDDPTRVKVLQNSCLSAALGEDERAEYLVDFDDDDRLGALLLYMKPHNVGEILVVHRALLLSSKWCLEPNNLHVLEDAIVALKAIDVEEQKRIAYAVRLEVWQSYIRPFYRAILMGFHDVQEINADVVGPLFNDAEWLNSFSKFASKILNMLTEIKFHESERIDVFDSQVEEDNSTWPPVADCFMLQRLVEKNQAVSKSSLEAHQVLIFSMRVTRDIPTLSRCTPNFYDLFSRGALFTDIIPSDDIEEKQHEFMQDAIVDYARTYNGPVLDRLDLGDIGFLVDLWDFEMENVRTLFLLSMYEYGKDRIVDELITKSATMISAEHFCEGGVEVVCRRLHHLLHVQANDEIKKIMGTLDADMCEWIREKAVNSEPLVPNGRLDVPVGNTHLFGLRLLSLAASAEISKEDRIKIHSLIVLSGTIVKTLEGQDPES